MEAPLKKGRAKPVRNDAHTTPRPVYEPLEMLGGIGLDPCGHPSNLYARKTVLLPEYAAETDPKDYSRVVFSDGLEYAWGEHGLVFANMPFSDIEPWTNKARYEGDEVVLLLPARVNAGYLHRDAFLSANGADAVHFPHQRIKFLTAETQPPWHSMLLYYGPRWELFAKAYAHFGVTFPCHAIR